MSAIEDEGQQATTRPVRAPATSLQSAGGTVDPAGPQTAHYARPGTLGWQAESAAGGQGEHVVQVVREGDTLYSIAKQHEVPVAVLFSVNGLVTDKLVPGQQLVIPTRP